MMTFSRTTHFLCLAALSVATVWGCSDNAPPAQPSDDAGSEPIDDDAGIDPVDEDAGSDAGVKKKDAGAGIDAGVEHCSVDNWCTVVGAPTGPGGFAKISVLSDTETMIASYGTYRWSNGSWSRNDPTWSKQDPFNTFLVTDELYAIWSAGANDVWVAGDVGYASHFTNSTWHENKNAGTASPFRGIWGTTSTDMWAVNEAGVWYRWNGSAWAISKTITATYVGLTGFSATDVWAFGHTGTTGLIDRYNGTTWTRMTMPTNLNVGAIWGSSATDVYASVAVSGTAAAILHYDGTTWTTVPVATGLYSSIWGTGPSDVWLVGSQGKIQHFNGTAWSASDSGVTNGLLSISGSSATNIWIAHTGGVLRKK